jgi:hypothetical protein
MLTLKQVELLAENHSSEMYWNGWDLVITNKKIDGFSKVSGLFHKGTWVTQRTIRPDSRGLYAVPKKYTLGK